MTYCTNIQIRIFKYNSANVNVGAVLYSQYIVTVILSTFAYASSAVR